MNIRFLLLISYFKVIFLHFERGLLSATSVKISQAIVILKLYG